MSSLFQTEGERATLQGFDIHNPQAFSRTRRSYGDNHLRRQLVLEPSVAGPWTMEPVEQDEKKVIVEKFSECEEVEEEEEVKPSPEKDKKTRKAEKKARRANGVCMKKFGRPADSSFRK